MMYRSGRLTAFTLAELLIALAILGVIATFTIPKILASENDAKKRSIFKEDISSLNAVIFNLETTGDITVPSHLCATSNTPINPALIYQNMNYLKQSGMKIYMANGSTIKFNVGWFMDMTIDWNGDAGNNTLGDDALTIYFNDTEKSCASIPQNRIAMSPGGFSAPEEITLYDWIYQ